MGLWQNALVLATYVHDLDPVIVHLGPLSLRWYGLAYVASFVTGYWLYRWLAKRRYTEMRPEDVGDFITWAAVFGVMIGGRLGWVLGYGIFQQHDSPWWPIEVWKGGMASHGGIIGLVIFTFVWSRRKHLSWTSIGDSLCVVAPIGLFLVRCANFINGELWGKPAGAPGGPATVPWAVVFPGELNEAAPFPMEVRADPGLRQYLLEMLPPRHPSQIYQALLEGLVLFVVLWVLRTKFRVPRGFITGVFFIGYAVLRIIGEVWRVPDSAWSMWGLSAGQFLSLFLLLIGPAFILWSLRVRQYELAYSEKPWD